MKAKFHVEPPWEGGKNIYINGVGNMAKKATTPIFGENLQKSSTELIVL